MKEVDSLYIFGFFWGGGGTGGKCSLLQAEKFKTGRTEMTESYEDDHNDHPLCIRARPGGCAGEGVCRWRACRCRVCKWRLLGKRVRP